MRRFIKQRSVKAGMAPGTLMYIGDTKSENTVIEVFEFNTEKYSEYKFEDEQIDEFEKLQPAEEGTIRWINIDGLKRIDTIERLGRSFDIHPLVMEDILNTDQRAKIEDYDRYLYIVAKMLYFSEKGEIVNEQVSVILGDNYVISIGERKGDVFEKIRERIRNDGANIRRNGTDFLVYSILDAVVDGYFGVLETLGDRIDDGEEELLTNPSMKNLQIMQDIKKDLLYMHKSIWPLREVASWMEQDDTPLIKSKTHIYLRDVYDHIIQAIDTTETYRELLSDMMDIYLSSTSNKMNEVMKVLTIISTIFIPLSFLAGIYGMNFKYMPPELDWKYGYFGLIAVMAALVAVMITVFKKKKWL